MRKTDLPAFYREVGRRIHNERERLGLTQEALGSLVSLSRTSITNIERGKQKLLLHTFLDIADALQVSPAALLPETSFGNDQDLKKLLRGQPRKAQEWIKTTVRSIREEE